MNTATASAWAKSQVTAMAATSTDFILALGLTKVFGIALAVFFNAIGAVCGAVVSFLLLRHWAFQRHDQRWQAQAVRYAMASGTSVILNTSGVWLAKEIFDIQSLFYFGLAKTIVAVFMGLTVNYLLFKHFVFR